MYENVTFRYDGKETTKLMVKVNKLKKNNGIYKDEKEKKEFKHFFNERDGEYSREVSLYEIMPLLPLEDRKRTVITAGGRFRVREALHAVPTCTVCIFDDKGLLRIYKLTMYKEVKSRYAFDNFKPKELVLRWERKEDSDSE